MDERFRIDWENLTQLPRRKRDTGATREDLAERRYNMQKAKHKGRCHITNQKRRQIAAAKREGASVRNARTLSKVRTLKDAIRAYWRGEREEHP